MTVVKLASKVLDKPLNAKQYVQLDNNPDNRFPVGEEVEVSAEQLKALKADDTITVSEVKKADDTITVSEVKKESNPGAGSGGGNS